MEIKQTTLQDPSTVQNLLLDFDPLKFNQSKKHAEEIIQDIVALKAAYDSLELKRPFDQQRFNDMVNGDGAVQVIDEFKEATKKDETLFNNPVSRMQTIATIETFANQLYRPLRKVKEMIGSFNKNHSYQLTSSDFEISGNDVIFKTDSLEKHCSVFLSQKGVEAYPWLHELALCYNKTFAAVVEKNGITLPYAGNLISAFFAHEIVGEDWQGGPRFGSRIEISKKNLGVFNRV